MADSKPAPVATPEEVQKLAAFQEQEWGTFVAVQPISFNGVPAYNVGDPVPVSNVKRYKYDEAGVVEKVGTKAAQSVIAALHEAAQNPAVESLNAAPVSLNVPVK